MTDGAAPEPDGAAAAPGHDTAAARCRALQRRRLDEVFGEALPSTTDDERDPGDHDGFSAEHYRRDRPPHHVA